MLILGNSAVLLFLSNACLVHLSKMLGNTLVMFIFGILKVILVDTQTRKVYKELDQETTDKPG